MHVELERNYSVEALLLQSDCCTHLRGCQSKWVRCASHHASFKA